MYNKYKMKLKLSLIILTLSLSLVGCKNEPVNPEPVNFNFAETRTQVEETTKNVLLQTGANLMFIKKGVVESADENLDDQTKEDLSQLKEDTKVIGKNSAEAVKEIYEDTISEEHKEKINNIGNILSNKTKTTIDELKNNHSGKSEQ